GLCHANLLVSAPTAATCCVSAVFIPFISDDTAPTDIYTLSLHDALPILVYMELSQEVSKPGERDPVSGNVAINKRKVETQVAVQSGETVLLGGFISEDNTSQESGVPGVSNIPVLGRLFRKTTRRTDRKELVVLITPRVIQ